MFLLACAAPPPPPCVTGAPIGAEVHLQVWSAVDDPNLDGITAWWAQEGLAVTVDAVHESALETAIGTADGATPEARRTAVLAPLQRMLDEGPADGTIHLLIVPRVAKPDSPLLHLLPDLDGLTLTPFAAPEDPIRKLVRLDGVAPLVAIGADTTRESAAHELGHALGLPHVDDPGHLMARERRHDCRPGLDDTERARLRDALGVLRG